MDAREEDRLCRVVDRMLEERLPEFTRVPGVVAVGMGWRDRRLKFVVQTESVDDVHRLRAQLPDDVDTFKIHVELVTSRVAASAPAVIMGEAPEDIVAAAAPERSVPLPV